jgi:hypothetical protein
MIIVSYVILIDPKREDHLGAANAIAENRSGPAGLHLGIVLSCIL